MARAHSYPATRKTAESNSTYKLSPSERVDLGMLAEMALWSNAKLAKAYGVNVTTVRNCRNSLQWKQPDIENIIDI